MAIGLVQGVSAASSAAGPITIVVPCSSTSAGNYLVFSVAVAGASTSIANPGGWTQLATATTPGILVTTFGRITAGATNSVNTSLTATGGGAAASLMEFSGIGANPILEFNGAQAGTGTNPLSFSFPAIVNVGQLSLYCVGSQDTTLVLTATGEWSANIAAISSTIGAPNVRINTFWASNAGVNVPQINGGSLGASVPWADAASRLKTAAGGGITYGPNGAVMVPQFYQGMIGG